MQETVQSDIGIKEGKTLPPKPYTEGQLIAMMKTCGKLVEDKGETDILKEIEGLGTEATRSGIIETIKKHGYITVSKNIVSITPKGRVLCQAIEGNLLASPSMTAKWETYLRKIGNGEGTGSISRQYREVHCEAIGRCTATARGETNRCVESSATANQIAWNVHGR